MAFEVGALTPFAPDKSGPMRAQSAVNRQMAREARVRSSDKLHTELLFYVPTLPCV